MHPAFVRLQKHVTKRNAQILYRDPEAKSHNDPMALLKHAA